ncbi:MAG: hypothetical protein CFE28_07555 [Alphaproteobacteria bacterium PA2]|nr:MAG: hypothetical protein CFE28_07555 [Alphaproteobacteria bacterium PA2]
MIWASGQSENLSRTRLSRRAIMAAAMVAVLLWAFRGGNVVDRIWSDLLTASQKLPVSSEYVVVNIRSQDMVALWDVSSLRHAFAERVLALKAAGAKRILLDMFLSGTTMTTGDRDLSLALRDFGKDRSAFGRTTDPGFAAPTALYQAATILELGILSDPDGHFRSVRLPSTSLTGNPAIWLASGQVDIRHSPVDLRLDPDSVTVYSLDETKRPEVLAKMKDKVVIFSLDRSASRSRASLPVYGMVDRGRFLAIAADSYKSGTDARLRIAGLFGMVLAVVTLCAGLFIGARTRSIRASLTIFPVLCIGVIACCLYVNLGLGAPSNPVTTISIGAMAMTVAIGFRLGIPELIAGLFAGDLSPEEAWLWRSQADQDRPVLLFGADGSVRRSNPIGLGAFDLNEEKHSERALQLARLCMPGIGERAEILTTGERSKTRWRVEWPHNSVPLAVFFDVTDQVSKVEDLRRKLVTDPLTGLQNRSGFDAALAGINMESGAQFVLFYMDMNGFKQVNDTLGHDAGDELLAVVARRFSSIVRERDVLARLGGDEFGLCVHGEMSQAGARRLAEKLQETLNSPIRLKKGEVRVGVAVGFSIRAANDTSTAEVIRRADEDMYRQKKAQKEQDRRGALRNLSA